VSEIAKACLEADRKLGKNASSDKQIPTYQNEPHHLGTTQWMLSSPLRKALRKIDNQITQIQNTICNGFICTLGGFDKKCDQMEQRIVQEIMV